MLGEYSAEEDLGLRGRGKQYNEERRHFLLLTKHYFRDQVKEEESARKCIVYERKMKCTQSFIEES